MRTNRRPGREEAMLYSEEVYVGSCATGRDGPVDGATFRFVLAGGSSLSYVAVPLDVARQIRDALDAVLREAGCPNDPSTN